MPTVLSESTLAGLRELQGSDTEFMKHLISIYLENLDSWMPKLEAARASKDFKTIAQGCHQLKSSSRNLGAEGFGIYLENCEMLAKASDPKVIDAIGPEFAKHKHAVVQALQSLPEWSSG